MIDLRVKRQFDPDRARALGVWLHLAIVASWVLVAVSAARLLLRSLAPDGSFEIELLALVIGHLLIGVPLAFVLITRTTRASLLVSAVWSIVNAIFGWYLVSKGAAHEAGTGMVVGGAIGASLALVAVAVLAMTAPSGGGRASVTRD
jgi:hypothetical protein